MLNLTSGHITIERADGTRAHLPPAQVVPRLVMVEEARMVVDGGFTVIVPSSVTVDFTGVEFGVDKRTPVVVTRDIFDALPDDVTDFVTPDFTTAIVNGLKIPHVIKNFIAKPGFSVKPRNPINNQ